MLHGLRAGMAFNERLPVVMGPVLQAFPVLRLSPARLQLRAGLPACGLEQVVPLHAHETLVDIPVHRLLRDGDRSPVGRDDVVQRLPFPHAAGNQFVERGELVCRDVRAVPRLDKRLVVVLVGRVRDVDVLLQTAFPEIPASVAYERRPVQFRARLAVAAVDRLPVVSEFPAGCAPVFPILLAMTEIPHPSLTIVMIVMRCVRFKCDMLAFLWGPDCCLGHVNAHCAPRHSVRLSLARWFSRTC